VARARFAASGPLAFEITPRGLATVTRVKERSASLCSGFQVAARSSIRTSRRPAPRRNAPRRADPTRAKPAPTARSPLAGHSSARAARPGRRCPVWSDRWRCGTGRSAAASRPRRCAGRRQGGRRTPRGDLFRPRVRGGSGLFGEATSGKQAERLQRCPALDNRRVHRFQERAQAVGDAGKQNMRVSAPGASSSYAAGPRFEPQRAHRAFEDHGRTARQRAPPTFLAFGASYEGAARFPISTWGRRPG
jgi:hypothetical protein